MKKKFINKSVVLSIMLLFVGTCAGPCITGNLVKDEKKTESTSLLYHGPDRLERITPHTSPMYPSLIQKNSIEQVGHTLVSDLDSGRVIEIDANGTILWEKSGLSFPVDVDRLNNGNTLIAEVGAYRVIEVNNSGAVVWSYTALSGSFDADRLANGNTLIADTYGHRVIEVTASGVVVWEKTNIGIPSGVERLRNGNTLITDILENRIIEVDNTGALQWEYVVAEPWEAKRLANGNTLIACIGGSGVIEVTKDGTIIWEKTGIEASSVQRLGNGNTLIASGYESRVIEVNSIGSIVWEFTGALTPFDADRIEQIPVFNVTINKGFGVTVTTENIGDANASNVEVTITVTGSFVLWGKVKTKLVGDIAIDNSITAKSLLIGFGKITIEAKVTCDEGIEAYGNTNGFLLMFFVI